MDGLGNLYVSGDTGGSLGGPNQGLRDAFLSQYDATGTLQWTRQLGSSGNETVDSVAADALGNVFIRATRMATSKELMPVIRTRLSASTMEVARCNGHVNLAAVSWIMVQVWRPTDSGTPMSRASWDPVRLEDMPSSRSTTRTDQSFGRERLTRTAWTVATASQSTGWGTCTSRGLLTQLRRAQSRKVRRLLEQVRHKRQPPLVTSIR